VGQNALIHLYWLEQIMFCASHAVKFAARGLCPKCNVRNHRQNAELSRDTKEHAGITGEKAFNMSAFDDHKDELEHFEQMFGTERGRLAVALDRMTNALVLAGQHGVYCTSQRNPTLPAMDLRMINQELVHAKELVQSVMEELRKKKIP
jgi:hypothetical protein